jgi:2-methylcitrate dehydratase PrpD
VFDLIPAAVAVWYVSRRALSDKKLHDAVIRCLLERIEAEPDPDVDPPLPKVGRAYVMITTASAKIRAAQTDMANGAPDDRLTDRELIAKFRLNPGFPLTNPRQGRTIDAAGQLDQKPYVDDRICILHNNRQLSDRRLPHESPGKAAAH